MRTWLLAGVLVAMLFAGQLPSTAAQYTVGDVVSNFALYTRRPWTNSAGKAFAPGSQIRLTDFAGKIIFLEFFDPT